MARCPKCKNMNPDTINEVIDVVEGPVWSRPFWFHWCMLCNHVWGKRPAGKRFRTEPANTFYYEELS